MAMWGSKKKHAAMGTKQALYIHVHGGGDSGWVPKGYVPMLLVGDSSEDEEQGGQRILVNVRMLKEPCIKGLLEMAEQQFGFGQSGVLRIPCSANRFDEMIRAMISKLS